MLGNLKPFITRTLRYRRTQGSDHWPGNVRELENEVERAVVVANQSVTVSDLSAEIQSQSKVRNTHGSLDQLTLEAKSLNSFVNSQTERLERELVCEALKRTGFMKTKAAKLLGVSRPTLDSKIEKYKIKKSEIIRN